MREYLLCERINMDIKLNKIATNTGKERCYVHARGVLLHDGFGMITMQKLELSGSDVFYGIEMIKSYDGFKTFTEPQYCENLKRRYLDDKTSYVLCDATPYYHRASGKIILTGHMAQYGEDNKILGKLRKREPLYAVYNTDNGDFEPFKTLQMPDNDEYYISGAGCTQIVECDNGDILMPIYYKGKSEDSNPNSCFASSIVRCSFDGENMHFIEIGDNITTEVPRGLYEPSLIKFGAEYFLTMRNDKTGFVTKGEDGLHFGEVRPITFDDGEDLGSYNTQQHWLVGGGKLWLVYTRRAENNSHVFRHRAPLFIAEFDPERMCVLRDTERIAVPERGARLGNFGCQSYSDKEGYVYAAEWMQSIGGAWDKCAAYGSDNSIFISRITY